MATKGELEKLSMVLAGAAALLGTAIVPSAVGAQCRGGGVGGGSLEGGMSYAYAYETCAPDRLSAVVVWRGAEGWTLSRDTVEAAKNRHWLEELQKSREYDRYGLGGGVSDRFIWALAWSPGQRRGAVIHGRRYPQVTTLDRFELTSDSIHVVLVDGVDSPGGPVVVGTRTLAPALMTGIQPDEGDLKGGAFDPSSLHPADVLRRILEEWPAALEFVRGGARAQERSRTSNHVEGT